MALSQFLKVAGPGDPETEAGEVPKSCDLGVSGAALRGTVPSDFRTCQLAEGFATLRGSHGVFLVC